MKYSKAFLSFSPIIFIVGLSLIALALTASGYIIPTDVMNGGGEEGASASYRLYDSAGQPVIGDLSTSASYRHFTGFWYTVYGLEPDFGIDVLPDTQEVELGDTAGYEVTLTSINGFATECSLTVSGTPPGATPHFNPEVVTPTGSSVLSIATGGSDTGTYVLTITARSNDLVHDREVLLVLTPFCSQWSVPLNITGVGITNTRVFGVHCDGTDGYDAGLDTLIPPPGFDFYSYFLGESPFNYMSTDIRSSDSCSVEWTLIIFNPNYPDSCVALDWDSLDIPDTMHCFVDDTVNMRTRSSTYFCAGNMTIPIVCSCFTRGDANGDGAIDVADVMYLINYLFIGGSAPDPLEAGDANCDGVVDIADVMYLINYLFIGGSPPGC